MIEPNTLIGKLIIKGTHLAIKFIMDLLAQGLSTEDY